MLHTKKGRVLLPLSLGIVYFLLFFIHYEFSAFIESDLWVEIISYAVFLLVSACSAFSAYVFYCERAQRRSHLYFLLTLSMRLFYQIPYYYIYYVTDYYTSGEALLLGALMGLVDLVAWYAVFVLVALVLTRLGVSREGALTWLCIPMPLYELFLLVCEIVLYLIDYRGLIFTDDLPYFIFGFVYVALLFASAYFCGGLLIKKLLGDSQKGE